MASQAPRPLQGILLKCLSVLLFIVMSALIKTTGNLDVAVPPGQQVFFRSFFALPLILGWLMWQRELLSGLRTSRPMGHVYRGVIGTASMALSFWALSLLPLPEVTALSYAAPLLVVIFAGMFLGEDVRLFRLSMVGLGLIGVLIVLSPQLGDTTPTDPNRILGAVVALGSAIFAALAHIFIRKLAQVERTTAIVFWFTITSTVLSFLTIPFGWIMPDASTMALLIGIGLIGGLGQVCLTAAYRFADASVVAPFDYTSMIFAVLIGWFVFGEAPTLTVLAGAALVVLAGILILWREHRLRRDRQHDAMPPSS
ncbi:MAG: DMT family transporter [Alphaproteobacteria bacterium]|nr:DMT family transporter [Alphaproteobacteria bacterium]